MTMQPAAGGGRAGGGLSALVSHLSSFPTRQLGFGDSFSQVAALLGNKNKPGHCPQLS